MNLNYILKVIYFTPYAEQAETTLYGMEIVPLLNPNS